VYYLSFYVKICTWFFEDFFGSFVKFRLSDTYDYNIQYRETRLAKLAAYQTEIPIWILEEFRLQLVISLRQEFFKNYDDKYFNFSFWQKQMTAFRSEFWSEKQPTSPFDRLLDWVDFQVIRDEKVWLLNNFNSFWKLTKMHKKFG